MVSPLFVIFIIYRENQTSLPKQKRLSVREPSRNEINDGRII